MPNNLTSLLHALKYVNNDPVVIVDLDDLTGVILYIINDLDIQFPEYMPTFNFD